MSIRIRVNNKPFSKDPGAKCMLPLSPYRVTVYPTKLVCSMQEMLLPHTGVLHDFHVEQNIDKGWIRISGTAAHGRVAYRVMHRGNEVILLDERSKNVEKLTVMQSSFQAKKTPKLSFGATKKQDVYSIRRRVDPAEYLPLLYHIGKKYPQDKEVTQGLGALVQDIENAITQKQTEEILTHFNTLFLYGFESIFSPVLHDVLHSGLIEGHLKTAPHAVLAKIADLIEQMLFQEIRGTLTLLPALPSKLVCGRMTRIPFSLGEIDIEWTKKKLRRAVIRIQKTGSFSLTIPQKYTSFRVRRPGSHASLLRRSGDVFPVCEGDIYFLDRFQK